MGPETNEVEKFDAFERGDKVFDIAQGWGEVEIVRPKEVAGLLNIFVAFASGTIRYNELGITGRFPSLSFVNYSGKDSFSRTRPLPEVKTGQLVYVRHLEGGVWQMRYFYAWINGWMSTYTDQRTTGGHTEWVFYSLENPLLK
jgi:hypothetical protein